MAKARSLLTNASNRNDADAEDAMAREGVFSWFSWPANVTAQILHPMDQKSRNTLRPTLLSRHSSRLFCWPSSMSRAGFSFESDYIGPPTARGYQIYLSKVRAELYHWVSSGSIILPFRPFFARACAIPSASTTNSLTQSRTALTLRVWGSAGLRRLLAL
jgi:hypothetical protein